MTQPQVTPPSIASLEVILGQYNRQGPISLWKICPIFKGNQSCLEIDLVEGLINQ